ncbi:Outer membrane porin F precursor [Pseudogemmobacter humi]|uniref:Outer membrane porin F n=2 Tax=Pseudogemmobacter humi TaxID=2483812 RepID=A0A3P5XQ66_9RHOB|nr:Outer membrane porin F precursor [Pseudogemmobacter humi]
MLGIALASALMIEHRTGTVVISRLSDARMDWATVTTDGMLVHLSGTAPNEAARFRALNLVSSLVDSSRIRDTLDVTPTSAIEAPRFSVEMLRNDDGIQLGGLMPATPDAEGLSVDAFVEAASYLTPDDSLPVNMLQSANWPAPEGWNDSLSFGIEALGLLKRSKISVSAGRVEVTAIADSPAEKRRLESELSKRKPRPVVLETNISAPRPVITPFTLRFIKDAAGARFDACSADTDRARTLILNAAAAAGMEGPAICTVGMGTPSPRWSEAAVAAIRAVAAMEAGTVTFSDADITFAAGEGVSQATFDNALGDLRAALPDVFSLDPVPPAPDTETRGPAEFTARRLDSGRVELRGRLVDEVQQAATEAFARAAFGAGNVYVAAVLDPDLPDGWPVRVLAGLESLSLLDKGTLVVRPDAVEVKGITGSQDARARITQILSSGLGQGQNFRVDVSYDVKLDPLAALPTPQECAAGVDMIMSRRKITFTPGSAEIAAEAGPVIGELAEVLSDCPGIRMEIAGHTDSQGSESGNAALSQARAEAVMMALLGRRVDTSGMTAVGYGESNPIADNATETGREANRRIEFTLKEAAAAPQVPQAAEESEAATPAAAAPAVEATASGEAPDFSADTSPSVAPAEKTVRPRTRPAEED